MGCSGALPSLFNKNVYLLNTKHSPKSVRFKISQKRSPPFSKAEAACTVINCKIHVLQIVANNNLSVHMLFDNMESLPRC